MHIPISYTCFLCWIAESSISITFHLYFDCNRNDVVSLTMKGHLIILMLSLVELTHIILLSWKGLSNHSNTVENRTFNIICTPLANRCIWVKSKTRTTTITKRTAVTTRTTTVTETFQPNPSMRNNLSEYNIYWIYPYLLCHERAKWKRRCINLWNS